jgi:predicted DNA-binding transcriptional regulator AlpA
MESLVQLPVSLNVAGLAALLDLSPRTIYNILSTRPWRLPVPVARSRKQRLVWLTDDVLAWMRRGQHQPDTAIQDRSHLGRAQPSSKKIGRPSKAEQVRRQSQGAAHG